MFPEGSTTNGTSLSRFKRGAFEGMRAVRPVFSKFNQQYMNPTYDVVPFFPWLFLIMSSFTFFRLELTIMPEFCPTDWMLVNRKNKSEQDWEVYAESVREAIGRYGGFKLENRSLREKLAYEHFMCGDKRECTIDGKTFTWESEDDDY